ncbi:carbon starvation protein CstA [Peribacillus simplex]|nr:carbon starvation protein CstA [Peribacillus simplex]
MSFSVGCLIIAVPLFIISIALTQIDFNILWRYFSWANQSTAVIALFVGAMYLYIAKKNYWVSLLPGIFMLYTVLGYILNAQIGFRLSMDISYIIGAIISAALVAVAIISAALVAVATFFVAAKKQRAANIPLEVDIGHYKKPA